MGESATIAAAVFALLFSPGCDFKGSPVETEGFQTKTHIDSAGRERRYVLFVPHGLGQHEKPPVILFLNGFGENGGDGLRQISNNFGINVWRMQKRFPFIAVCPQCSGNGRWSGDSPDTLRALAILDDVIEEYGGDRDRVYLTGVSAGGSGVWEVASAYPERFAALVPISAGGAGIPAKIAEARLPVWSFYNAGDSPGLVRSARTMREELLEAGLSPLATEYDRLGHKAWDAYDLPTLYAWLLQQNRTRNARSEPFKLLHPEDVLNLWEKRGSSGWSVAENIELTAAANRHDDDSLLIGPPVDGDFDFHADVALTTTDSARLMLLDADDEARNMELTLELPAAGPGELRAIGDDDWMSLDPVAQRALRTGWNDVRLSRENHRLKLSLNGRLALDIEDPTEGKSLRWALVASGDDSPARWRYLRYRTNPAETEDAS